MNPPDDQYRMLLETGDFAMMLAGDAPGQRGHGIPDGDLDRLAGEVEEILGGVDKFGVINRRA